MNTAAESRGPSPLRSPLECVQAIQRATNQHDLEALAACFDPDYQSEFPVHLGRAFRGQAQMRKNWANIFAAVPDIHSDLLHAATDGDTIWAEWEWRGTRVDGNAFHHRGVTVQGVRHGLVVWVRMYMEPVQEAETGADVPNRGFQGR